MANNNLARLHVFIEGRVQGVGFRYFVVEKAEQLGLTGWVRNTSQGEVEALVEGHRQQVDLLMEQLRRGPHGALVLDVRIQWESATGEYTGFDIFRTV